MTNLRKSVLPAISAPGVLSPEPESPGLNPSPEASSAVPVQASGVGIAEGGSNIDVAFHPTEAQSKVRAKFWARVADNPLLDVRNVSLAQAQQMTNSAALRGWWEKPGFKDWFLSATVVDERLDYLLHLALASAEDILLNTDPKAQSARVQMVKIVAEMAGRLKQGAQDPKAAAAEKKKKAIEAMGQEELVKFLQDQGLSVQQVVTIEK